MIDPAPPAKKQPRRKKLVCPCGVCRWCYRCNRWVDANMSCTHDLAYRRLRGKPGIEEGYANE